MKRFLIGAMMGLAFAGQVTAQRPACGTDAALARALADPQARARQADFEDDIYQATEAASQKFTDGGPMMTLPLVFHIVHANGPENISDLEIQECVSDVNAYFNASFAGPNATSTATGIQFCLATRDDWGRPHTGIEHILDTARAVCTSYEDFEEMTRTYYWPTQDVINVYVLKDMGGVIGMGYFPFLAPGVPVDGVYMVWDYCGRDSTRNTVLAHELGHYLGLFHTFEGGCRNNDCLMQGDRVCDTPPDAGDVVFEGCGTQINSCATDAHALNPQNPFDQDVPDQSHNFMDYIQTECMELFSPGQCARMRHSLTSWRPGLLASQYCDGTRLAEAGINAFFEDDFFVCDPAHKFRVQVVNNSLRYLEDLDITYGLDGGPMQTFHWEGGILPTGYKWINLPPVADIPPGKQRLHVRIDYPNGFVDPFPANDTASLIFHRPGDARRIPYHADFEEGLEEGWSAFDTRLAKWEATETTGCDSVGRNGAITLTPPYLGIVKRAWLVSGWVDLGDAKLPYMTFDYAFRRSPGHQLVNTLRAYLLTDCDTFAVEELYLKSQNQISGPFYYDSLRTWIPERCEDWRTERVALPDWLGSRIMVALATDIPVEHNQRIYFDNIRISSPEADAKALAGPTEADVLLFPVPNDGRFTVAFPALEVRPVTMRIYNSLGQQVHRVDESTSTSHYSHDFDLRGLASGVYHLELRVDGGEPIRKKFMVFFE